MAASYATIAALSAATWDWFAFYRASLANSAAKIEDYFAYSASYIAFYASYSASAADEKSAYAYSSADINVEAAASCPAMAYSYKLATYSSYSSDW